MEAIEFGSGNIKIQVSGVPPLADQVSAAKWKISYLTPRNKFWFQRGLFFVNKDSGRFEIIINMTTARIFLTNALIES